MTDRIRENQATCPTCGHRYPIKAPKTYREGVPKSLKDCALWLRAHQPDKLEGWLDGQDKEVRWWLETQEGV